MDIYLRVSFAAADTYRANRVEDLETHRTETLEEALARTAAIHINVEHKLPCHVEAVEWPTSSDPLQVPWEE